MKNYFLTKIKVERTIEDGAVKKVTEVHLVDALSFTEAEARINKEMEPFISGEFSVDAITRKNYVEIIDEEEGDKWFECKVNFITLDEVKGVEKKTASLMLVAADNTRQAEDRLRDNMKGTLADYEIEKIAETKILEVFRYTPIDEEQL